MKRVLKVFAGLLIAGSSHLALAEEVNSEVTISLAPLFKITAQGIVAAKELKFELDDLVGNPDYALKEMKDLVSDSIILPGRSFAQIDASSSAEESIALAD